MSRNPSRIVCAAALLIAAVPPATGQIPISVHARILQLEDERNLNGGELEKLFKSPSPDIRERAALAAGRIGDKRATVGLLELLASEKSLKVRLGAAFALGEMEDASASIALLAAVDDTALPFGLRARAAEALGKIFSIQTNIDAAGRESVERAGSSIIRLLPAPSRRMSPSEAASTGLLVTALMRLRQPASVKPLTGLLASKNPEIRSQAANALSRLRLPIGDALPALTGLLQDTDEDARANAARALGVVKSPDSIEPLIAALSDRSEKVVVSSVRALAAIGDARAVKPLIELGMKRMARLNGPQADDASLMLELASALGRFRDERALPLLRELRAWSHEAGGHQEIEIAAARFGPAEFFKPIGRQLYPDYDNWRHLSTFAAGLGELPNEAALETLLKMLNGARSNPKREVLKAVPEILDALARIKTGNLDLILRDLLESDDDSIRASAASIISQFQSPDNLGALLAAYDKSRPLAATDDKPAILTAVSRYRTPEAVDALKSALADPDHLIRRRAVELLRAAGQGDFSASIGTVRTGRTPEFYRRAIRAIDRNPIAVINTNKGPIRLRLFTRDAPLTVDSFVTLARKGFFDGLTFHRVVPNFVIQAGDPLGTGEGGPGYQIRCEINTRPYLRGSLGMALSGKDTGGSQFFITHAPQPHLDGGYTVFGQVLSGMTVVDRIIRTDTIKTVTIPRR